jgi:acetamidase/formamidase
VVLLVESKNCAADFLKKRHPIDHVGLSKDDAYSLMSVAADFAATQVVDGRQGCHLRIPRSIFPKKGIDLENSGAGYR